MKLFKKLSFLGKIFTGMTVTAIIPMLGGYLLLLQVLNLTARRRARLHRQRNVWRKRSLLFSVRLAD